MSKKTIKNLRNKLSKIYIPTFEKFESQLMSIFREGMVDPDEAEESLKILRGISTYISNINSTLFIAENSIDEFYKVYHSQLSLNQNLLDTESKIREQDPDSELLINYKIKRDSLQDTLVILHWIKEFICLPKSKKRIKKWKKKDLGYINRDFWPFMELDRKFNLLEIFIIENFL